MGRAARRAAHRCDPARIVDTYEDLFVHLAASQNSRARQRTKARSRGLAARILRRLGRLGRLGRPGISARAGGYPQRSLARTSMM